MVYFESHCVDMNVLAKRKWRTSCWRQWVEWKEHLEFSKETDYIIKRNYEGRWSKNTPLRAKFIEKSNMICTCDRNGKAKATSGSIMLSYHGNNEQKTRQSKITLRPLWALPSPLPRRSICSERDSDGMIPSDAWRYWRLNDPFCS